ncbi:hypothetical protein [Ensifer soli]|uniref:hypothetical protein n=1 Tax=Ciceribacter sp. sgz301302 TaxID=3342379 RepID=UPI0035B7E373
MTPTEAMIVLDTLLPGGDGFPCASEAGLAAALDTNSELAEALSPLLALAGDAFAGMDEGERIACLERIEAADPDRFRATTTLAYAAYYTSPAVLAVISAMSGYRHPPQPGGYVLPDFDEAVMATVRNNPVSWRPTTA